MASPDFLRPLLQGFGYELEVDLGAKITCRVIGNDEKWEASGSTADEALDRVMHAMCPSTLAWDLFLESLHSGAVRQAEATRQVPVVPRAAASPLRVDVVEAPKLNTAATVEAGPTSKVRASTKAAAVEDAPSSLAATARRGEPPPRGASTGELASWVLRALDELDTPEILTLARANGADLKSLGETGIPLSDRRIRRKWRDLWRKLG